MFNEQDVMRINRRMEPQHLGSSRTKHPKTNSDKHQEAKQTTFSTLKLRKRLHLWGKKTKQQISDKAALFLQFPTQKAFDTVN